ncbi:MAG: hypothetical protein K2H20_04750 [Bacilli bacterium]|nr:hypothetical protein [Bacilli bacterium]
MQKIILIVGDSGSGKDFVMNIANMYPGISVVKRYISRGPRDGEDNSISSIFSVPIDVIKGLDYYYEGAEAGRYYGIKKSDLEEVLNNGMSAMVVCPNYENYLQMCRDFPELIVPIFVFRGYEDSELENWRQSLRDRGSSQEEIENREKKRDKYFRELYVEHTVDYASNVILNLYGLTTPEDIMLQIEGLCEKNDIDLVVQEVGSIRK